MPSDAEPPHTPGSPGVTVTNPKLLTQFGGTAAASASTTPATRASGSQRPGAHARRDPDPRARLRGRRDDFKILAENLIPRVAADQGWRSRSGRSTGARTSSRTRAGLDIAEAADRRADRARLALRRRARPAAHPGACPARPARRVLRHAGRRAVPRQLDATSSSRATSTRSSSRARRGRATTTSSSAATRPAPASPRATRRPTSTSAGSGDRRARATRSCAAWCCSRAAAARPAARRCTDDTLDRIEAKFDGGLFGAVRDNAPRCVDGTTPCTIATEATDCAGQPPPKCTPPTTAYAVVPGLLNPRILATPEPGAIQARSTRHRPGDHPGRPGRAGQQRHRQGARPRRRSAVLPPATGPRRRSAPSSTTTALIALVASFLGDLGRRARPGGRRAPHLARHLAGPRRPEVLPNNGPAPTTLPGARCGAGEGSDALRSASATPSSPARRTSPTGTIRARA